MEIYTKKLDDKAWKGRLCSYNQDTKVYHMYNPATCKVSESRNVIFVEIPS